MTMNINTAPNESSPGKKVMQIHGLDKAYSYFVEARQRYRPDSLDYQDSWGYLIQASRYGGFVYQVDENLFFLTPMDGDDQVLVLSNYYGDIDALVEAIHDHPRFERCNKIILKSASDENSSRLYSAGFREYRDGETWDESTTADDQSYPQVVVDSERLINKRGNRYSKLNNVLNQVNRRSDVLLDFRAYDEEYRNPLVSMLTRIDNGKSEYESGYLDAHLPYLDRALVHGTSIRRCVLINENAHDEERLVGFFASDEISGNCRSLIANVTLSDIPYVNCWGVYNFISLENRLLNCEFYNFGGSENYNLFYYKKHTYRPCRLVEKKHLVYERS